MNRIDRNARELVRAMAICGLCLAASVTDPARAAAQDIAPVTTAGAQRGASESAGADAPPADPAAMQADAAEQPGAAAPSPVAERHLEAVRAIEDEGGAYAPELPQHLLGLGLAYQRQGRHAEAVETLNRAAHVSRVNEGLYNAGDIPLLEHLIESYAALGDWEQVDNRYQQVFAIHHRNYGERDARLLPALQKLSSWHLRAYIDGMGGEPLNHLLTARNLFDASAQLIQDNYGPADARMAKTLRQRALVDYYLASYAPPPPEAGLSFGTESMEPPATPIYVVNSFVSGRDALRRVVELRQQDGASTGLERSQALAELADWHQLFSRRQTALRLYQDAWTVGAQDGALSAQIQASVFGRPLALPVLPAELDAAAPGAAGPAWITVRFAVNESGRAEDVEVIESSPPAADKHISRLRKRLLGTAFRPRFDAGQPVATANVAYRYTYTP
ncbi:MAG: tetratricopeptide repeat protein [Pseudomonadales bacterium]|jgi:tetratricopeptide (TPR) repeat protein|nr:tetratricopeptide repeat protein [Pseudomonadales bacterium]MBP9032958.1 tetratricopeptide repeat protein [Pseudomonadales bacterium]